MHIGESDLQGLMDKVTDIARPVHRKYMGYGPEGCLGLAFVNDTEWNKFVVELTSWVKDGGDQLHIPTVEDARLVIREARIDEHKAGIIVCWPYGGLTLTD